jgi:hypothetical protein
MSALQQPINDVTARLVISDAVAGLPLIATWLRQ